MCLLVVSSPNSTPSKKHLQTASCNNPHGFGYAVIAGNKIITGRGMSSKKVIAEFLEVRKQHPSSYAMFHCRYATHGVKNEENCHPFAVGGSNLTYLAHNGVLPVDIKLNDKRSDTRIFAEDILPRMGGVATLDDSNLYKMIEKWASGSKIAVFTLDPDAEYDAYIINEDLGHWDNEGNWWSNTTYTEDYSNYLNNLYNVNIGSESDVDEEYVCQSCGGIADKIMLNELYCDYCGCCWDCGMTTYNGECLCWSPDKIDSVRHKQNGFYDGVYDF